MRRHLGPSLSLVHVHHLVGVDGETTVRVDRHAEQPGVGLDMQYRDNTIKCSVQFVGYNRILKIAA